MPPHEREIIALRRAWFCALQWAPCAGHLRLPAARDHAYILCQVLHTPPPIARSVLVYWNNQCSPPLPERTIGALISIFTSPEASDA